MFQAKLLQYIIAFAFGIFTFIIFERHPFFLMLWVITLELLYWNYCDLYEKEWNYMQRVENNIFYFTGAFFSRII
jgi:hypothetical protein